MSGADVRRPETGSLETQGVVAGRPGGHGLAGARSRRHGHGGRRLELPAASAPAILAVELLLHGWDLAEATGQRLVVVRAARGLRAATLAEDVVPERPRRGFGRRGRARPRRRRARAAGGVRRAVAAPEVTTPRAARQGEPARWPGERGPLLLRRPGRPVHPGAARGPRSGAGELALTSGSGVFARGRLDIGTAVLFRETKPPAGGRILDLGLRLRRDRPRRRRLLARRPSVTGVDVNERAVLLANENAARARRRRPLRGADAGRGAGRRDVRRDLVQPAHPDRQAGPARPAAHLVRPAGAGAAGR